MIKELITLLENVFQAQLEEYKLMLTQYPRRIFKALILLFIIFLFLIGKFFFQQYFKTP